jgi:hypothetical protein
VTGCSVVDTCIDADRFSPVGIFFVEKVSPMKNGARRAAADPD